MSIGPKAGVIICGREAIDDDFDMYRPHGLCASCLVHPATEVWVLYKGPYRWEFRCACCVARGRLEKAHWYAEQIPTLELALGEANLNCKKENPE
jgi:hypothetical protein